MPTEAGIAEGPPTEGTVMLAMPTLGAEGAAPASIGLSDARVPLRCCAC